MNRATRLLTVSIAAIASLAVQSATATTVRLSNDSLEVLVDESAGTLTVVDRVSGRTWKPDPWLNSAGLLQVATPDGWRSYDLSRDSDVSISRTSQHELRIEFRSKQATGETPLWCLTTSVALAPEPGRLSLNVVAVELPDRHVARKLYYPARPFSLRTDVDRGAAVIPFWQGVLIPSHIFPMNGGRFCMWDDAQHDPRAVGELTYYGWHGLTMPWFGTHDDRSAAMAVVPRDGSVGMQWIANYNNVFEVMKRHFHLSSYPRILALTPVWKLDETTPQTEVVYHVLPNGNHVTMAKRYREIAKENGLFVSLEEKAKKNPDVRKLQGAMYVGIYGGYPHYVNLPGMAFTFDELDKMVRDMHDNLGLKKALIHSWGTFDRYAPVMWPISEELGGAEKLRLVVDRVKGYGWLYSAYHSFVSILDHDPQVNLDLAAKDDQGRPIYRFRWNAVDQDRWVEMAKATIPKERAAIAPNADITDIAFCSKVGEGGHKLAEYLASTGLVLGTERGNEWLVPKYHMFEGLVAPYQQHALTRYGHIAPLFNLVYHDAITIFGKIQDSNHLPTSPAGDYYVKTLRAMLYGDGPMIFFSPYEYEGIRPYIKLAAETLGPLHESIAFKELVAHRFLSRDFLVQQTEFAGGVQITVNLGSTPFHSKSGLEIPAYGFRVVKEDGKVLQGRFRHNVVLDGREIAF